MYESVKNNCTGPSSRVGSFIILHSMICQSGIQQVLFDSMVTITIEPISKPRSVHWHKRQRCGAR